MAVVLPAQETMAAVVMTGVGTDGHLLVPDDPALVGWWAAGARPGDERGSVVLAGHVDSRRFGVGKFKVLFDVAIGDPVWIVDAAGAEHHYRVVSRQQIDKDELPPQLFDHDAPPQLVLITCGGTFDETTRHYSDNVIVIAEPAPTGSATAIDPGTGS